MSWDVTTGKKCPKCNSPIVKKGKIVKCSNSECDFRENNEV